MTLPSDAFRHVAARPHEPLRTFHPRRTVLGRDREDALERLWPRWGSRCTTTSWAPRR
ncbi:hypothetical protein [Cellulomonas soli]